MSILNLLNATFGSGPAKPVTAVSGLADTGMRGVTPTPHGATPQNATPTFGIRGREPLTQDMFEYKGKKMSKQDAQKESYTDVYRHEAAHLSKAGKYATSGIVIDFDGNGIATSGHVNIAIPVLNPADPKKTIEHADTVIAAAEAPASFDDLSDADKNVAAQARAVRSKALNLIA